MGNECSGLLDLGVWALNVIIMSMHLVWSGLDYDTTLIYAVWYLTMNAMLMSFFALLLSSMPTAKRLLENAVNCDQRRCAVGDKIDLGHEYARQDECANCTAE